MLGDPNCSVDISGVASTVSDGTVASHENSESLMDGISMISMKLDSDTKKSVEALTSEGMSDEEKNVLVSELSNFSGSEIFEFSTCNRVLYVGFGVNPDELILAVEAVIGVSEAEFQKSSGMAVWRDLVRICSGLDSFILGELQVMGQFRDAVAWHKENGHVSAVNSSLFDHVISANRIVRKEMSFDKTTESMLNLATSAMKEIIQGKEQLDSVVLGFGDMGSKAVESLIDLNQSNIIVISRNPVVAAERHPKLAQRCTIKTFDQWVECGGKADLVISTLRNKMATFTESKPFPGLSKLIVMDFSWPSSFTQKSLKAGDSLYGMEHWIRRARKLGVEWKYEETLAEGEEVIRMVEENFQMALNNLSQAKFRSTIYATLDEKSETWEDSFAEREIEKPQLKAFSREIAGWICQTNGVFDLSDLDEYVKGTSRDIGTAVLNKVASDLKKTVLTMEGAPKMGA